MNTQPLTAAVVDDEPLALRRAARLLKRHPEFLLVGSYASVEEALRGTSERQPDLFLVDVRMPDHDGFELVRRLRERGCQSFVIFVTAFSQRAHEAFDVGAVDYVLKPFDEQRLARALERAHKALRAARGAPGASGAPPEQPQPAQPVQPRLPADRLLVSERGKVVILQHRDIEYVRAAGKYACVRAGGHYHILRQPLSVVESRLDGKSFLRIHRSTIVNIDHIAEMHALFHGDYEVILRSGERLQMSRRYRSRLADLALGAHCTPA
jgi:two-component system LytT family response regulator